MHTQCTCIHRYSINRHDKVLLQGHTAIFRYNTVTRLCVRMCVYCAVIDYSFNCITSSVSSLSSHCRRRRRQCDIDASLYQGLGGAVYVVSARLVMSVAASSLLSFNGTSRSIFFLLRTDFRRVLVTGHQRTRNAKPPSAVNE